MAPQGFSQQPTPVVSGGAGTPAQEAKPVGNSPFLFVQYAGQQMPIAAYVQAVLLLVAILSVFVSIVLFAYSSYLTVSIKNKREQLAQQDASLPKFDANEMSRFYLRMTNLDKLIKNYISVRSPLKFLEDVVEKDVVFNNFNLSRKDSTYVMSFSVITTNYKALYQQLEALNLSQYSKIVPGQKKGKVSDSYVGGKIAVSVTVPISASGILPEDIIFMPQQVNSSTTQTKNLP